MSIKASLQHAVEVATEGTASDLSQPDSETSHCTRHLLDPSRGDVSEYDSNWDRLLPTASSPNAIHSFSMKPSSIFISNSDSAPSIDVLPSFHQESVRFRFPIQCPEDDSTNLSVSGFFYSSDTQTLRVQETLRLLNALPEVRKTKSTTFNVSLFTHIASKSIRTNSFASPSPTMRSNRPKYSIDSTPPSMIQPAKHDRLYGKVRSLSRAINVLKEQGRGSEDCATFSAIPAALYPAATSETAWNPRKRSLASTKSGIASPASTSSSKSAAIASKLTKRRASLEKGLIFKELDAEVKMTHRGSKEGDAPVYSERSRQIGANQLDSEFHSYLTNNASRTQTEYTSNPFHEDSEMGSASMGYNEDTVDKNSTEDFSDMNVDDTHLTDDEGIPQLYPAASFSSQESTSLESSVSDDPFVAAAQALMLFQTNNSSRTNSPLLQQTAASENLTDVDGAFHFSASLSHSRKSTPSKPSQENFLTSSLSARGRKVKTPSARAQLARQYTPRSTETPQKQIPRGFSTKTPSQLKSQNALLHFGINQSSSTSSGITRTPNLLLHSPPVSEEGASLHIQSGGGIYNPYALYSQPPRRPNLRAEVESPGPSANAISVQNTLNTPRRQDIEGSSPALSSNLMSLFRNSQQGTPVRQEASVGGESSPALPESSFRKLFGTPSAHLSANAAANLAMHEPTDALKIWSSRAGGGSGSGNLGAADLEFGVSDETEDDDSSGMEDGNDPLGFSGDDGGRGGDESDDVGAEGPKTGSDLEAVSRLLSGIRARGAELSEFRGM
ncbi:hypothetical protein BJ741DRAFT_706919 [Chytriomyces cf. hyalinus JEL632]|nr:hypothetical protein BJ741DRAFT_706919 [Chytriomyces cf. hyalinus JEL632]